MNGKDLINAVAEKAGMTKKDAAAAVSATFDIIQDTMASGQEVQIQGFGTFKVAARAARVGRNPQTGEEVAVAAKKAPVFKPGNTLKASVNV